MRFLFSLPLPLLLILLSFSSFGTQAAPLGSYKSEEPWSTTIRPLRRLQNDTRSTTSSYKGRHSRLTEPYLAKSDYDYVKPLASIAEGAPPDSSYYDNLSTEEVNKQLDEARIELGNEKDALNEAEQLLNTTIDQAKAANEDYEAKKGEWERLKGISDGTFGEYVRLGKIAKEAQRNVTSLTSRISELNGTIETDTEAAQPLIDEFERAKKRVAVLANHKQELKNANAEAGRLKNAFDSEDGKATTLKGQLDRQDGDIRKRLQPNVEAYQTVFKKDDCGDANKAKVAPCLDTIAGLKRWNGELFKAQGKRNATFAQQEAAVGRAKELKTEKAAADRIVTGLNRDGLDLERAKKTAGINFDDANIAMMDVLNPLNEAIAERNAAMEDLPQAINAQNDADAKVTAPSPEAIAAETATNEAFTAQDNASRLKTTRDEAVTEQEKVYNGKKKLWEATNVRVAELQKQMEKRTAKGGTNQAVYYIVGAVILCLGLVGGAVGFIFYRKKRQQGQKKGQKPSGSSQSGAPPINNSTSNVAVSAHEQNDKTPSNVEGT